MIGLLEQLAWAAVLQGLVRFERILVPALYLPDFGSFGEHSYTWIRKQRPRPAVVMTPWGAVYATETGLRPPDEVGPTGARLWVDEA